MKRYISEFFMPTDEGETGYLLSCNELKRTCYNNIYPFKALPENIRHLEFEPITILYGANGSGKTTMLNLIAESLKIKRTTRINKSSFFESYASLCEHEMIEEPQQLKIITSDDVFSSLFLRREKNEIIDENREKALGFHAKCNTSGLYIKDIIREEIGDDQWINHLDFVDSVLYARGNTGSKVVKKYVGKNIIGQSNGETAIDYFYTNIQDPGLYLLDEPENSLSAKYQRELSEYLFGSVRFFGAQLIISTHSPFMLSIPGAKIYNLDEEDEIITNDWTSLENMKEYFELFKFHRDSFEK